MFLTARRFRNPTPDSPRHPGQWSTRHKILMLSFLTLVVGLFVFRWYLPTLVKNYLNRALDEIPGYKGHMDDVTLHLWRGAYSIWGLQLLETTDPVPVP